MKLDLPSVRIFLYIVLFVFSFIEMALCAARLHYTLFLPRGDPLNQGHDFFDPIVAELLFTTLVTMIWSVIACRIIHRRHEYRNITTFGFEILWLSILWLFWIIGAAIATSFWGNLNWCHEFSACRLLTALVAFAWMNWIILFSLLGLSVLFTIVNAAFSEPMHGRYDPRESHYRDSGANYGAPMRDQEGLRRFMPW